MMLLLEGSDARHPGWIWRRLLELVIVGGIMLDGLFRGTLFESWWSGLDDL